MANVFHNGKPATGDHIGGGLGHLRGRRIIIFAGQQRHLASVCIDRLDRFARVPVDAVIIHVALVHAGSALAVIPPIFAAACFRR